MKKIIALGVGAVGAAALGAVFGSGIASADDYAGQTYADASSAISGASEKAVIATVVGDSLAKDDCIVDHSQQAAWIKGDDFAPVTDTVLLYLNCNAKVATNKSPGNSAASPAGQAELAAEAAAAQQAAAQQNPSDELAGAGQSVGAPGAHKG